MKFSIGELSTIIKHCSNNEELIGVEEMFDDILLDTENNDIPSYSKFEKQFVYSKIKLRRLNFKQL